MTVDAPNPEPSDVGPAAGGDVPATPDDREHATALLNAAYAEGHLTAAQRDQRVAAARTAATFDDLIPLTRDLMAIRAASTAPAVIPTIDTNGSPTGGSTTDVIVAIFSAAQRQGRWHVKPRTSVFACFGGAELDMTAAVFGAESIDVIAACLFGGMTLTVPPGCEVRNAAGAIFGGVNTKGLAAPVPGMPVITLRGFCLFGGISVRHV